MNSAPTTRARSVHYAAIAVVFVFCLLTAPNFAKAGFQVDSSGTLMTSLDSYWSLDGNANDLVGQNSGTDHNNTYGSAVAKVGQSSYFNGSNAYISMNDVGLPTGNGARSLALWLYPIDANWVRNFFGYGTRNVCDEYFRPLIDYSSNARKIRVDIVCDSTYLSSGLVTLGAWNFVVFTWDGSTMHYYINNSDAGSAGSGNAFNTVLNNEGIMGAAPDGSGGIENQFYGYLDEVGIWGKVLSAQEISDLWNNGNGNPFSAGLGVTSPQQLKSDTTTPIGQGSSTDETTVVFKAQVHASSSSGTARLEVEVQPAGVGFTGTPNATSTYVNSSTDATITKSFDPGQYHWQARAADAGDGATSTWQYAFSDDTSSSVDFVVDPKMSAYFDGSSAWKWPATNLGFNSTEAYTIELFYDINDTSTARQILDTRTNDENGFAIWKDTGDDGAINFVINCGGSSYSTQIPAAEGYKNAEGYWHHIAVTKVQSTSTDTFKFLFDGVRRETQRNCYTSTSTDSIWIGGNPSSSMALFKGNIDEVRIWDIEKSVAEIAASSSEELPPFSSFPGLVGHWTFNATSSDIRWNNAPSGQHGIQTFVTSTPFGHFLFVDDPDTRPWTSVNTSTNELLWHNSSTQYVSEFEKGSGTWNTSTSGAINIASTTTVISSTLIVDDVDTLDYSWLGYWWNVTSTNMRIFFNIARLTPNYSSTTIQHIAAHELGHALGLAHSVLGNLMYPYTEPSTVQTWLGPRDKLDYEYCWGPNGYCKNE